MSEEDTSLQSSPQLVFNEQQEGVAVVLSEKETVALYKKSKQSGYSFDTLQEVYRRGYLTWDLHLNESPEQFAFNRVNSFIAGGKASELDQDLVEKVNLPHKYRAGLSDTTAAARKAHWEKMSKYSDRDPRAYQPAPGDATAKTKPSKHTKKFKQMYGEEMTIDEAAETGLAAKAKKSGVSIETLRKVYRRGVAAWNSGHRPGTTPQQWGMARVNSYITKGKGTYHGADKDLREEDLEEKGPGLWANIHAKRERIKRGSGERMRKPGSKGAPTPEALKSAKSEAVNPAQQAAIAIAMKKAGKKPKDMKESYTGAEKTSKKMEDPASRFVGTDALTDTYKNATPGQSVKKIVKKVVEEKLYEMYNCGCKKCGELEESGLRAKHKSPSGGLTQAGRNYYNRKTGGNLKAPVTTKPSKLKKGSKAANRRKSFCARMGGMKKRLTSAKTARDPNSRINKALRKWNC
jgi:lambda repressor-like predicted transcriptional regulator